MSVQELTESFEVYANDTLKYKNIEGLESALEIAGYTQVHHKTAIIKTYKVTTNREEVATNEADV